MTETLGSIRIPKKYVENDKEIMHVLEKNFGSFLKGKPAHGCEFTEKGGIWRFSCPYAKHGEFTQLEIHLRRKEIPYNRFTGSHEDEISHMVIYRPKSEKRPLGVDITFPCLTESEFFVETSVLKGLLDLPPEELREALAEIIKKREVVGLELEKYA